jgi:hypothetical protein
MALDFGAALLATFSPVFALSQARPQKQIVKTQPKSMK